MTAFVGASLDQTYNAADLTGANSGKVPGIGDIYVSHDNKRYRFVRYRAGAGAVAGAIGNAVGFYGPAGASTGLTNEVSADVSDTNGALAGVLVGAPTDGQYGWIQTGGVAIITPALVSGADGNAMTLSSTTDGSLKVTGAVTDAGGAVLIDSATKTVMLNCPT
ncbi:hypothetical protein J2S28_001648 [Rhizobium sp. SLBN-94]|nr:hypothetical protein [Rhizobium sp. SLBN-94]